MLKFIPVAACLVFILVSLPFCAFSQDKKSDYEILLEQLKSKDPTSAAAGEFRKLRFAYAETPQYNPYGGIKGEMGGVMLTAVGNKEYGKALEYAEKIMKEDFVDIDAHMVASLAYAKTGNKGKADYHRAFVGMLVESMLDGGNGETPETAIEVITVDEEYALLNITGLRSTAQSTLQAKGHQYDKLTVSDPATGGSFDMYFCIDRPFNWLQKSFKKGD